MGCLPFKSKKASSLSLHYTANICKRVMEEVSRWMGRGRRRGVSFLHQILLVAGPPCQVPCEDLGVNSGFKARLVCMCVWGGVWGVSVGWVGWCQMGAGGRSIS